MPLILALVALLAIASIAVLTNSPIGVLVGLAALLVAAAILIHPLEAAAIIVALMA